MIKFKCMIPSYRIILVGMINFKTFYEAKYK